MECKPPVTRWCNNLSDSWETTCMDKIASISNSIFAVVIKFWIYSHFVYSHFVYWLFLYRFVYSHFVYSHFVYICFSKHLAVRIQKMKNFVTAAAWYGPVCKANGRARTIVFPFRRRQKKSRVVLSMYFRTSFSIPAYCNSLEY